MISFYPGPSRVYDNIPAYVRDAYKSGIMSINHRSDEFMRMYKRTVGLIRKKLMVPSDYSVIFTSSATECWEIIAQSLASRGSIHAYNGAFGQKWYEYTKRIGNQALSVPFGVNEELSVQKIPVNKDAVICLTQNETSNGTQLHKTVLEEIRNEFPAHLIAIDATSSMAGIRLRFELADVWFASVQKCFGLPAGLAVMICSQRAIDRAKEIGEMNHYNSLSFVLSMMEKWQTSYTPNVLGIYLLMRTLEDADPINTIERRIKAQYHDWISFLNSRKHIRHFVDNQKVHSYTVVPVKAGEQVLNKVKTEARQIGFLLGEGYGEFKPYTFRIANFPALKPREIKALQKFLKAF